MTEEHLPGCTGKRPYATKRQAERRAKIMRRKKHSRLAEYHCNHCRKWHVGEPHE